MPIDRGANLPAEMTGFHFDRVVDDDWIRGTEPHARFILGIGRDVRYPDCDANLTLGALTALGRRPILSGFSLAELISARNQLEAHPFHQEEGFREVA